MSPSRGSWKNSDNFFHFRHAASTSSRSPTETPDHTWSIPGLQSPFPPPTLQTPSKTPSIKSTPSPSLPFPLTLSLYDTKYFSMLLHNSFSFWASESLKDLLLMFDHFRSKRLPNIRYLLHCRLALFYCFQLHITAMRALTLTALRRWLKKARDGHLLHCLPASKWEMAGR